MSAYIIGVEARGFMFGPSIALAIGAKFVPLRKPRKLPGAHKTLIQCSDTKMYSIRPKLRVVCFILGCLNSESTFALGMFPIQMSPILLFGMSQMSEPNQRTKTGENKFCSLNYSIFMGIFELKFWGFYGRRSYLGSICARVWY